jgi:hypothetical protein
MKIRNILFMMILFSCSGTWLTAQVTEAEKTLREQKADTTLGWRKGGVFAVNLAQTSLTNWAAGGQNSFATNGLLSIFANQRTEVSTWTNSLDMGYGVIKQNGLSLRKTDDRFDFTSKYGRQAFDNVYYAALLNFRTQFTEGRKYFPDDSWNKISDFLAPGYLVTALGLDYKPNNYFSAFLAPITYKLTIVSDDELSAKGAFGVDPGKNSLSEFGGYMRVIYSKNDFQSAVLNNISFTTKIDLFSNYLKNPQNIVINWETLIAMKINRFISANINTQLIYDDKVKVPFDKDGDGVVEDGEVVGSRIQFKEILGIGFSYTF